jgi:hypothetical protein
MLSPIIKNLIMIGIKAGKLKAKKILIITENEPAAPATIPPSTKAIKVWCATESMGKRKMPAEPQTTPEKVKVTKNNVSQRPASSRACEECPYLKQSKYLRSDMDIITENHMIKIECGMTFHSMKLRMNELTRLAIMPIGACL